MKFFKSRQAPVRPLLQELTFTQGNESWGLAFRRGAFRITADDFKRIAKAMSSMRNRTRAGARS
jgi:hypothetical protein